MAAQVGTAQIAVTPVFKGFRSKVNAEVSGASKSAAAGFSRSFNKAGTDAGATTGRGFEQAFASNAKGAADAAVRDMTKSVATASSQLATARLKDMDAIGKVKVAEAQLQQARANGNIAAHTAAQERYNSSLRAQGATAGAAQAASQRLTTAQQGLARAQQEVTRLGNIKPPSGFVTGIQNAVTSAGNAIRNGFARATESAKKTLTDLGTFAGSAFKTVAATAGAVFGSTLLLGGNRLAAIETAEAKLRGLGNSTEDVENIMKSATAAVTGTAFSLGDAAQAAGQAAAAGVGLGEMEEYLKTAANGASAAGIEYSEMASIMGQVRGSTVAQMDNINRVTDRGIPILQELANMYGVTVQEVKEMASASEISAADFETALKGAVGTVAQEMGTTLPASFANAKSAMGRFGATVLGPIYPVFAQLFQTVGSGFDALGVLVAPWAEKIGGDLATKIGGHLDKIKEFFTAIKEAGAGELPDLTGIFSGLGELVPIIAPIAGLLAGVFGGMLANVPILGQAFVGLTGPIGLIAGLLVALFAASEPLREAFAGIFTTLGETLGVLAQAMAPAMDSLASSFTSILEIIGGTLAEVITLVVPIVAELITALAPLAGELLASIASAFVELLAAVLPLASGLIGALLPVISALLPVITGLVTAIAPIIGMLVSALVPVINALVPIITTLVGQFAEWLVALMPLVSAIIGLVPSLLLLIQPLLTLITTLLPPLLQLFMSVYEPINQLLIILAQVLVPVLVFLVTVLVNVITWVAEFMNTLTNAATGNQVAIDQIVNTFNGFWAFVSFIFNTIVGFLVATFTRIVATVTQWGSDVARQAEVGIGRFVNFIQAGVNNVVTFFTELPQNILTALGDLGNLLLTVGEDMIAGLVQGITDSASAITDAVGDVIGGAVGWAEDLLQIKSPSRVFKQIGLFSGEGLAIGIKDSTPGVQDAMSSMVAVPQVSAADFEAGYSRSSGASSSSSTAAGTQVSVTQYITPAGNMESGTFANQVADQTAFYVGGKR